MSAKTRDHSSMNRAPFSETPALISEQRKSERGGRRQPLRRIVPRSPLRTSNPSMDSSSSGNSSRSRLLFPTRRYRAHLCFTSSASWARGMKTCHALLPGQSGPPQKWLLAGEQHRHQAAERPHIDELITARLLQQNLGRHIPEQAGERHCNSRSPRGESGRRWRWERSLHGGDGSDVL